MVHLSSRHRNGHMEYMCPSCGDWYDDREEAEDCCEDEPEENE